ncbi:hypothetical protein CYD94_12735 [Ralstonia solanacearum]|nr:hypothetical protein CYD94_12735 [Ralstonia solanacearum]
MDSTAAHSDGYSPRCSCTMRTARSRTSGENLFVLFMAPFSQELEPPRIPGRFNPSMESLDQEVAINFTAPIHLIAELLPTLRRQDKAYIINVSSGLAFSPLADVPVYCATKAAIHSFTLSLRHQLKAIGIRVIEIAPPIVDTSLGGNTRSAGTANRMIITADEFATEALAQLEADKDEILVGVSAQTRQLGEAMFERMNNRA